MKGPATPIQFLQFLAVILVVYLSAIVLTMREKRRVEDGQTTYRYSRGYSFLLLFFTLAMALLPWWVPLALPQRTENDDLFPVAFLALPGLVLLACLLSYRVVVSKLEIRVHTLAVKRVEFRDMPIAELYGAGRFKVLMVTSKRAQVVVPSALIEFRHLVEEIRGRIPAASFSVRATE